MATVPAKKLYNRRSAIVEPVFGLLKEWLVQELLLSALP